MSKRESRINPKIIQVRSENAQFQHLETLQRNRVKRQKHREFLIEGVRPINEALRYGWIINAFVYAREQPMSGWATNILNAGHAATHIELPLPLLQKLSAKEETSELMAIIAMPPDQLDRIPITENMLVVIFDRPASPGNLGTLIRSCDALGVDGLVITGHAADLYDPETISATTGSFFALPTVRMPSHNELLPWFDTIRQQIGSFQLVGSSAKAQTTIDEHDFAQPTLLAVGNETWGLSASYKALCDAMVTIPIGGSATSLNVACAASIMLYEIARQRRVRGTIQ
jgi:TrmH family RNA methyltransferase